MKTDQKCEKDIGRFLPGFCQKLKVKVVNFLNMWLSITVGLWLLAANRKPIKKQKHFL